MQARGSADQYFHAGVGLRAGAICAESHGNVPRQSLLHHSLHTRPIRADGLHVAQNQDHSLIFAALMFAGKSSSLHAIRNDPNRLYISTVSTISVNRTYILSRSTANAMAESITRAIGVAISSRRPSCITARKSPENAALTVP